MAYPVVGLMAGIKVKDSPLRKTPERRRRLDQREFVEVALRIVEKEGLDALSFRRLATELGVSAMSAFRIVRDKEDLLDLLTEAMFSQVELPSKKGKWTTQLAAIARSARQALKRYPELAYRAVRLPHMYSSPTGAQIVNRAMECLLEGGFRPDKAALAFAMSRLVQVIAIELKPDVTNTRDGLFYARVYLPPHEPALAQVAPHSTSMDSEEAFEFALEVMLLGFERYVESKQKSSSKRRK